MIDPIVHLRETLSDLMAWIRKERLSATIVGGVAAGLHGQPRLTEDVDIVVLDCDPEQLLSSCQAFGFGPRVSDAVELSRRTRVLLLVHRSGIPVDVSLGGLPFEREMIDRARTLDVGGLLVSVASPEDIVIMKSIARRGQDWVDIESIIETQSALDTEIIRRWTRELSSMLDMPEIFDDLEKQLRRRKH